MCQNWPRRRRSLLFRTNGSTDAAGSSAERAVWIHNDSGGKSLLFLGGLNIETPMVCHISNAQAVDWEDMFSFRNADQPLWRFDGGRVSAGLQSRPV